MNNNILEVKKPNNQLVEVDKKELQESVITYLKANNLNLTEVELKQFMLLCMIHNLNPIKKEVYAIKYNDKFDIITNYNEYLKRADATGLLAYYRVEMIENEKDPRYPLKAVFIGKRKDQEQEFRTECRFLEYTTGKSTWSSKPWFMLEKCALAKGLRMMFPNEIANMPYVNEELWYNNQTNNDIVKEHMIASGEIKSEKEEIDLAGVIDNE